MTASGQVGACYARGHVRDKDLGVSRRRDDGSRCLDVVCGSL